MHPIARRTFISSGFFGGLGLLSAGKYSRAFEEIAIQPQPTAATFIRRNVYCLTASSPEIRAYKKAITAMRARPTTDPTSWQAQSNIHAAFRPNLPNGIINICPPTTSADLVAPPGMIANACRHDRFFLAWHRIYLYYFERIVRKASGDPNFALPYWAYSPTGRRDLPEPFRLPGGAANPLWTDQRASWANSGGNMNPSAVDASTALAFTPYLSFQSSVNGTPHGSVHTAVGNGCGWMSAFETAGMDPIFWLHHCNIDRLWDDWIASGGGRVNPTSDPTWMNQTFNFYDEAGATVTLSVSQILDTATQLNFRYAAPGVCPTRQVCFCIPLRSWMQDERLIALGDSIYRRQPLTQVLQSAQAPGPVTLGSVPARAQVPFDAATKAQLAALARDPKAGRNVKLVIGDVRLLQRPAVYYEIYLDLPAGSAAVYTSPHYIGNLDFFTSGRKGSEVLSREYDLVMPFVRLSARQLWNTSRLDLTFVPRTFAEGGDVVKSLSGNPQATIGRISLVIE